MVLIILSGNDLLAREINFDDCIGDSCLTPAAGQKTARPG
jgi:hypothetical protein